MPALTAASTILPDWLRRLWSRPRRQRENVAMLAAEGDWLVARVAFRDARPQLSAFARYSAEALQHGALGGLRSGLITLLDASAYRLLQIETPNVPPEELRTAVRWQIKPMLDSHIDDMTVDVVDIPALAREPARAAMMLVVAASKEVLASQAAAFQALQLPLEVIDIPELALRNMAALFERPGQAVLLAWFNHGYGMLLLVQGGELYMVRNLDSGAHRFLRDSQERDTHLERIQRELSRTIDHVDRYFRELELSHLVLALPCDGQPVLDYLQAHLDLPVELAELGRHLDGVTELIPDPYQQVEAFPLLGAALRDSRGRA